MRPIIAIITSPKTQPVRRMLSFMSPLRMWLNSWATTPCNSSRLRRSRQPRVTPMTALAGSVPAANALIPLSPSITQASGAGRPDAMAISSTTLSRRRSNRSVVAGSTWRPPRSRATTAPPPDRRASLYKLPTMITPLARGAMDVASEGSSHGLVASEPSCRYSPLAIHDLAMTASAYSAVTTPMTASMNQTTSQRLATRARSCAWKKFIAAAAMASCFRTAP